MPFDREKGKYPNELRRLRESALLTRLQLSTRTHQLAEVDPAGAPVAVDTIRSLELGYTRPRPGTARILAAALDVDPKEIWVSGIDRGLRNLSGKTGPKPTKPPKSV